MQRQAEGQKSRPTAPTRIACLLWPRYEDDGDREREQGQVKAQMNVVRYWPPRALRADDLGRLWRDVEDKILGTARTTQVIVLLMKQRGQGTIVNISSIAAQIPLPYMAGYCATKFTRNTLSEALRIELANSGVYRVLVCPRPVRTPFCANACYAGEGERSRGRFGTGISAEHVPRATLRTTLRKQREVIVPGVLRLIIGFRTLVPAFTDKLI